MTGLHLVNKISLPEPPDSQNPLNPPKHSTSPNTPDPANSPNPPNNPDPTQSISIDHSIKLQENL
jgi:hypothetical protein